MVAVFRGCLSFWTAGYRVIRTWIHWDICLYLCFYVWHKFTETSVSKYIIYLYPLSPSLFIPIWRHFFSLQAWHWFRCACKINHYRFACFGSNHCYVLQGIIILKMVINHYLNCFGSNHNKHCFPMSKIDKIQKAAITLDLNAAVQLNQNIYFCSVETVFWFDWNALRHLMLYFEFLPVKIVSNLPPCLWRNDRCQPGTWNRETWSLFLLVLNVWTEDIWTPK